MQPAVIYVGRIKVYTKDRIGLLFFFVGIFQRYGRHKRTRKG